MITFFYKYIHRINIREGEELFNLKDNLNIRLND